MYSMDVCTEHLYGSFSKAEVYYEKCGRLAGWAQIITGMPSIKKLTKIS